MAGAGAELTRGGTVERAVLVFDHLAQRGPITVSDLAREVGYPIATVHRMLAAFVAVGWVEQQADSRYLLSPSHWWEYGVNSLRETHPNLLELLSVAAQELALLVQATVNVAILSGVDSLVIGRASVMNPTVRFVPMALRVPAYSSSTGKALLAFADEDTVASVCARDLSPLTDKTISSPDVLLQELHAVRRDLIAFNRGEQNAQSSSVAVPVLGEYGRAVAALAAAVPSDRFTSEFVERATCVLRQEASHLSMALGYRGTAFRQDEVA